jgi:hypothetical protein
MDGDGAGGGRFGDLAKVCAEGVIVGAVANDQEMRAGLSMGNGHFQGFGEVGTFSQV